MTSHFSSFTVRTPASTANFGSAFDAVGMALDLWLDVRVEPSGADELILHGEGADALPTDTAAHLIFHAARRGAESLGVDLPPLRLTVTNTIPLARGLGSSAAATAAGLLIARTVTGREQDAAETLVDATKIEGHPDNVAPALMGGACLAVMEQDGTPVARQLTFPAGLDCIAFVPDGELPTAVARSALPHNVPLSDASFNLARTALLIHVFMTQRWADLGLATEDRLHQPYRAELIPSLQPLTRAAKDAGAYTAFLSGAGPTVMSMAPPARSQDIKDAMERTAGESGTAGRTLVLVPSPRGAHVVMES